VTGPGRGQGVIRICSAQAGSSYSGVVGAEFEYAAGADIGWVRAAGSVNAPTGHLDAIHLALDASGSGYDKGFDARYALFGIPGLA
jgi:hypothetical protein